MRQLRLHLRLKRRADATPTRGARKVEALRVLRLPEGVREEVGHAETHEERARKNQRYVLPQVRLLHLLRARIEEAHAAGSSSLESQSRR